MSMTPQPGWYPDPQTPSIERWWDGSAWTEHRRSPQPPRPATVPIGFGPPPPASGGGPGRRSARTRTVALIAVAVAVVAAGVVGAVVLGGGDDTADAGPSVTPSPVETDGKPSPASSERSPSPSAPADDPSVVVDQLNGITLPVPDGWIKPASTVQNDVVMTTSGTYSCPGDSGFCRHGTVISRTVTSNDERSPKALARQDISDAADDAYDRDPVGSRPFGGITSHQQIKEGSVAVAGRAGYLVRWRVKTAKGPGGYVESLAFPSSVGSESLVIVRFAFDAGPDAPPLSDMDGITKGIRPMNDTATSGGAGSGIERSR